MRFDDAHVLGKEQVEVDNRIPFILGGSVRKIAKNHIYRFAGNALHHLKAIALNNPVADVWLEERVHRGAGDPPHRRVQVRSGCRDNGETRLFAKVIRLGDLFWRHIPVLWYNSPIQQSINRKD